MPEFIPLHANIHFKSAFDISAPVVPKIMTHLRQQLRSWCIHKVGNQNQLIHRSWFYIGNNPKVEPAQYAIGEFQIRTISAPSADPDEPNCWALELIHPDFEERARRWSVEITLRRNEDQSVRFTTIVRNWMIQNYIGEYPNPPSASAPAYVRSILEDPLLTCKKGDATLKAQPLNVSSKLCQAVYDQLMSDERQAPFVFVSHSLEKKGFLVDTLRISAALIGNANIYLLGSSSVVDEMNYYLGDALRCDYGSVRVYLPRIDKNDPANARLHRYMSSNFIAQWGQDDILRFLTNGLARNGSTFRLTDFTSFSDIFSERRRYAIQKLATENKGKSEETSLVWEENEKLTAKAAEWESLAIQYESENTAIKGENAALKYRMDEADRVRHRIKDLESQIDGMKMLASMPSNLSEVITLVANLFPHRIEVAENATATAKKYMDEHDGFWGKSENLIVAWEMAFSIATKLYDLIFLDDSSNLLPPAKPMTPVELI